MVIAKIIKLIKYNRLSIFLKRTFYVILTNLQLHFSLEDGTLS
jgi:hypothetical protein